MRVRPACWHLVAVVALLGAVMHPAELRAGDLVVGNLDQPPDTLDPELRVQPYLPQLGTFGLTAAQQFTTGKAATIDRVYASLGNLDLGTSGLFSLTAGLYSDDTSQGNSIPGSLVTTFNVSLASIPTAGFANVAFLASPISLLADTSYWFVLSGANSGAQVTDQSFGGVAWQYTLSTSTYGAGLLALTNQTFNGAWSNNSGSPDYTPSFPNEPFLMQVGVPEPSSWILGGIGLVSALATSRWMRRGRPAR